MTHLSGDEYFAEACQRNPTEYPKGNNGKYRCPCCMFFTLDEFNRYDICPVCFWEDDGAVNDGDFGGPNHMTLGEGKVSYKANGYVSEHIKQHVRQPLKSERICPENEQER